MKKRVISMFLMAAMLFSMAACSTEETDAGGGESEKEITVLLASVPAGLHPYYTSGWGEKAHYELLFDTLIYQTNDVEYLPALATEWELVDDGTNCNWIFKLRDDVYFSDGEQFTAEDVQFSLMLPLDEEAACTGGCVFDSAGSLIDEVTIIDDFTVNVHTSQPNSDLLGWILRYVIIPEHYYGHNDPEVTSLEPIGSGPYTLEEYTINERSVMVRRDDYWGWDQPYNTTNAEKITMRYVLEASTRVAEFSTGEVDIIEKLTPDFKDQVNATGTFAEITSGTRETVGITTYNNPALKDERVRQALNYAVDMDTIIDTMFNGYGEHMASMVNPPNNSDIEAYDYDPDKARELLKEAGWEDSDGDGVVENASGEELRLTMVTTNGYATKDKDISEAVCHYLEEIGIPTSLELAEWTTYSGWRNDRNFPYDIFLTTNGPLYFACGDLGILQKDSGANYYRWDDPEFEELYAAIAACFDPEEKAELTAQIEQRVKDGAPMIFLLNSPIYFGISDRVEWEPWTHTGVYLRNAVIK